MVRKVVYVTAYPIPDRDLISLTVLRKIHYGRRLSSKYNTLAVRSARPSFVIEKQARCFGFTSSGLPGSITTSHISLRMENTWNIRILMHMAYRSQITKPAEIHTNAMAVSKL